MSEMFPIDEKQQFKGNICLNVVEMIENIFVHHVEKGRTKHIFAGI
jgi:hypothetical protein